VPTNPRPALHPTWNYSALEVFADGVVHAVGLALGVLGGALMVHASLSASSPAEITAVLVYVAGLIAMLAFSAAYNLWRVSPTKWVLRRLDHSAIYVMIAGTYTPLMAQVAGPPAALALVFVWAVAVVGILIKMLLPGRYDRASILLYLLLSWSVIAVYDRVAAALPHSAILPKRYLALLRARRGELSLARCLRCRHSDLRGRGALGPPLKPAPSG
jgi:hemolysin III